MHLSNILTAVVLYAATALAAPKPAPQATTAGEVTTQAPSPTPTPEASTSSEAPSGSRTTSWAPTATAYCEVTSCPLPAVGRQTQRRDFDCFEVYGSWWNDNLNLPEYGKGLLDNLRGSVDNNIIDWEFELSPAIEWDPHTEDERLGVPWGFHGSWRNKPGEIHAVNWIISDIMGLPEQDICPSP